MNGEPTVAAAQIPITIRHTVKVVSIRRQLRPRVIRRQGHFIQPEFISTVWEGRRHIICQIQALHREVDEGVNFIRESAVRLESL